MPNPPYRRSPGVPPRLLRDVENLSQQTGSGDLGTSQTGGGLQILDSRTDPIWAAIDSQPDAGLNAYGYTRVDDGTGDGTYPDLAGTTETSDGDTLSGDLVAWEVNGRTDVATDGTVKVQLTPNRLGRGYTFCAPGSGGGGTIYARQWKLPVRVATVANGNILTAFAAGQVANGVTLALDDRILLGAQTDAKERQIVVVTAGTPSLAPDAATGDDYVGACVVATEGTVGAGSVWLCTTPDPITLGSTSLAWRRLDSPATTKGDLVVHNGTEDVRVPVSGTNGNVLREDSTQAAGVAWAPATDVVTAGGGEVWTKYSLTFANWPLAATSGYYTFMTLPAGSVISDVVVRLTTRFTNANNNVIYLTVGTGPSSPNWLVGPYFEASVTPSGTTFFPSPGASAIRSSPLDFSGGVAIQAQLQALNFFYSTGPALNLNQLTQGAVTIWVRTATLPP